MDGSIINDGKRLKTIQGNSWVAKATAILSSINDFIYNDSKIMILKPVAPWEMQLCNINGKKKQVENGLNNNQAYKYITSHWCRGKSTVGVKNREVGMLFFLFLS